MGPVSSRTQYEKVLSHLSPDRLSGTVLCGGGGLTGPAHAGGYFIAPAVVERPDPGSATVQEEIFGPVVSLLVAADLDDAIDQANGTRTACAPRA
jgi:acyl-CoA reductase-like NAD-dependent aldehyde dehydrogenase